MLPQTSLELGYRRFGYILHMDLIFAPTKEQVTSTVGQHILNKKKILIMEKNNSNETYYIYDSAKLLLCR